jgi:hypothetical protein
MKRFSLKPSWLRRRSRATFVVCPNCQAVAEDAGAPAPSLPVDPLAESARQLAAQQAVDGLDAVDSFRRQQSAGDPIKDQALTEIQAGFAQNVLDVARRLRRPGGPGERR